MPEHNRHNQSQFQDYFGPRIRVALALMLAGMGILAVKLAGLQLMQGESYDELARHNRTRMIRLAPARGSILDAKGRPLAENTPSFALSIVPAELENVPQVIETTGPVVGMTEERMRQLVEKSRLVPRFMNYTLKKNMTFEEVSLIKARAGGMRGVTVEPKPLRRYPMGETMCHIIGSVGEISADELVRSVGQRYRPGDMIGKSGIENECEQYLRGEQGWEQIEIDAKGKHLANLSGQPPRTGDDILLTIDTELQRYAEDIFIHRAGSIVAVDPDSGRVLVSVSKPGFDLTAFSPSVSERQWKALNEDPLHPLENRAIRGLYAPASTFKVVTAMAALAERAVTSDRQFVCKGEFDLWGQTFRCWNRYGHGKVDLHRALVESCDVYFYQVGLRLGGDKLAKHAGTFGFGKPTGLGLPHELPGLVPTSAWKQRTYGDVWKDGETVSFSIGQGYLTATPIQMAMMTAVIANGGKLYKPSVIGQIRSPEGQVVFEHVPVLRWNVEMGPEDLHIMRTAMRAVVDDRRGTGRRARIPGITVHAKTGTSQVIREKQTYLGDSHEIPYHERTHAIFVAFVNDRPNKIAVAVVVEHGGGGGASAGPLARKIIARYYGVPDPGDPPE